MTIAAEPLAVQTSLDEGTRSDTTATVANPGDAVPAAVATAWISVWDETSNATYYWNTETQEARWDPPEEYVLWEQSQMGQPSPDGGESDERFTERQAQQRETEFFESEIKASSAEVDGPAAQNSVHQEESMQKSEVQEVRNNKVGDNLNDDAQQQANPSIGTFDSNPVQHKVDQKVVDGEPPMFGDGGALESSLAPQMVEEKEDEKQQHPSTAPQQNAPPVLNQVPQLGDNRGTETTTETSSVAAARDNLSVNTAAAMDADAISAAEEVPSSTFPFYAKFLPLATKRASEGQNSDSTTKL